MRVVAVILAVAFAGLCVPCLAQQTAPDNHMQWWREARFGLFIHWGPVSIKGTEIGWSRGGERRGTGGVKGEIPVEVYDNLYKEFNPTAFNAKEWVAAAKNAGMKYLVFTTKHHDGFCMFDTALTDHKITNSPFKRDVVKELADACHEAGLKLGFYYSPPDWHHPDYRTANHQKYIEYLHGELRELCTKYGKVDIIWFDGLGGTAKDWDAEKLVKMIRELQPGVIINNRAGLPEDLDTPEQTIGHFDRKRAWETCMTMGDQWAYKPKDNVKPADKCIEILIRCAGGDGNLLLNIGPTPLGDFEPPYLANLKTIGEWMKKYSETIYGTRGGPYMPGKWGASTCRDNKVYLHLMREMKPGEKVVLPALKATIKGNTVLTGGKATVMQTAEALEIAVEQPATPDTIVALELDSPALAIEPLAVDPGPFGDGAKAKASNVHMNDETYAADKAIDGDEGTRWATDGGTHAAWLWLRLPKPITVDKVSIREACGDRVEEFELQAKIDDDWQTFYKGTKIGADFKARFDAVTAQDFRLDIKKASEGPTIFEFQLLPAVK
jgi:alpha-L-fucosidase